MEETSCKVITITQARNHISQSRGPDVATDISVLSLQDMGQSWMREVREEANAHKQQGVLS